MPRDICPPSRLFACIRGAGTVFRNAFSYNPFSPKRDRLKPFLLFALMISFALEGFRCFRPVENDILFEDERLGTKCVKDSVHVKSPTSTTHVINHGMAYHASSRTNNSDFRN